MGEYSVFIARTPLRNHRHWGKELPLIPTETFTEE